MDLNCVRQATHVILVMCHAAHMGASIDGLTSHVHSGAPPPRSPHEESELVGPQRLRECCLWHAGPCPSPVRRPRRPAFRKMPHMKSAQWLKSLWRVLAYARTT